MAALTAGCIGPSFLITPVSGKRTLVETEIARDSFWASDKIAIIDVSGVILNSHGSTLLGSGEHPVSMLLEQLDKARRDKHVKAVVLRINSPGGSVTASELMHHEIVRFKKSGKPIVAVMMDVAASGGYYIACACDEIVAQRSTVTGSIGVIMQLFDLSGTMFKIGVKPEAVTSGPRKAAGSPFQPLGDEERAIFQAVVDDMFDGFVQVVADGREGLDAPAVRALADGRIYTATQALDLGLIDRIATMRATIAALKKQIGSKHIRQVMYHRPYDYRPNYYARAPEPAPNVISIGLPGWLDGPSPRFMYLWSPGG